MKLCFNGAIAFTCMRLLLIPFIVFSLLCHAWVETFFLLSIAALTDILDGWYARKYHQSTVFGACLDTVVDKLLVVSVYATLLYGHNDIFALPVWFFMVIAGRELLVMGGAAYAYFYARRMEIKPTLLGKLNGFAHFLFMGMVLFNFLYPGLSIMWIYGMLYLVIGIVGASLIEYMYLFIRSICR